MLVVMSRDMSLLMQCIGNSHLIGCQIVKDEAVMISSFLDRHNKYFVESKVWFFPSFFAVKIHEISHNR